MNENIKRERDFLTYLIKYRSARLGGDLCFDLDTVSSVCPMTDTERERGGGGGENATAIKCPLMDNAIYTTTHKLFN